VAVGALVGVAVAGTVPASATPGVGRGVRVGLGALMDADWRWSRRTQPHRYDPSEQHEQARQQTKRKIAWSSSQEIVRPLGSRIVFSASWRSKEANPSARRSILHLF
jgi:hypothetical protein